MKLYQSLQVGLEVKLEETREPIFSYLKMRS
jgi:hypothetical protein